MIRYVPLSYCEHSQKISLFETCPEQFRPEINSDRFSVRLNSRLKAFTD